MAVKPGHPASTSKKTEFPILAASEGGHDNEGIPSAYTASSSFRSARVRGLAKAL